MKPKKNPKKDLNKKSGLFFVLGLMLVLGLAFVALEWKTYEPNSIYDVSMNVAPIEIDEEPLEIFKIERPKIKQVLPPEIKVEDNDVEIDETEILSTEADTETEIIEPEDLVVEEIEEEVNVNWITIEDVPVFPGCENAKDKRECFNEMMQKHIQKNFRYPEMAQEMGIQGRVSTQFEIKSDGSIGTIQKRGPHKILEEEAIRILSKLPKMTPGKQRGTPVKVSFSIPIHFKLQ
ncbi:MULTISPECIES: energy transducer TonB [Maribacter]|uniref:Energy transducer TonB n=1 Tax=Maribacter flavus TaxID=1658664 RepID=A0A5B2TQK7_9FLAO|nr:MULTISPECIES: energy transducer TonB [Maribacter]KAA2215840.1 energy transducer TonB [Maribacter flavus]MDC6406395.1 energy transducer TonB [Maribacter sp. PR66]MEE1973515.1 energy transducer TonB [Maribacter flavus]